MYSRRFLDILRNMENTTDLHDAVTTVGLTVDVHTMARARACGLHTIA